MRVQGKGAGLTSLSGISMRLKQWTTASSATSTSAGSTSVATTPTPKNKSAPAAASTAGMSNASANVVSSGTGGPLIVGYASMGASGPGGWVAINPDDVPALDGNAAASMDLFSASATASLNFEVVVDNSEF